MTHAERLEELRQAAGLTYAEVGRLLRLEATGRTVRRWLVDGSRPCPAWAPRLLALELQIEQPAGAPIRS